MTKFNSLIKANYSHSKIYIFCRFHNILDLRYVFRFQTGTGIKFTKIWSQITLLITLYTAFKLNISENFRCK